jgi:hypothetical protein
MVPTEDRPAWKFPFFARLLQIDAISLGKIAHRFATFGVATSENAKSAFVRLDRGAPEPFWNQHVLESPQFHS